MQISIHIIYSTPRDPLHESSFIIYKLSHLTRLLILLHSLTSLKVSICSKMTSLPTNLTERHIYGREADEIQPSIWWPGTVARAVTTPSLLSYIYTRKWFGTCKGWRWGPPVNEKMIYPLGWFHLSAREYEKTKYR